MNDKLKGRRKRGRTGEVKGSIIEYILSLGSPVEETYLIEHLKKKHGITERKNIVKHLIDLCGQGCIKGKTKDRWYINNIKQIGNIYKLYPELKLTSHEKVLDLIANEHAPNPQSYHRHRIKEGILSSTTFFELLLYSSKEEMHKTMKNYYLNTDEGLILKCKYNYGQMANPRHMDAYDQFYKIGLINEISRLELPQYIYKYEIIDMILQEKIRNEIIDRTAVPEQIEILKKMELRKYLFDKEIETDDSPFKGFLYPKKDEDGIIYLEEKDLKYDNEADIKLAEEVMFGTVLQTIAKLLRNPTQFETVCSRFKKIESNNS